MNYIYKVIIEVGFNIYEGPLEQYISFLIYILSTKKLELRLRHL